VAFSDEKAPIRKGHLLAKIDKGPEWKQGGGKIEEKGSREQ